MGMQKLYGRGAITLTDDRAEYRPRNGVLEVPDHLVTRAKALGFTTYPLPTIDEEAVDEPASIDRGRDVIPIDRALPDEDLLLRFSIEAMDARYSEDAAATIAHERLNHLRSGGDGYSRLALPAPADTPAASVPSVPPADPAPTT